MEDMPINAIRAAQNFHRTEFLDNVEKSKTYAARAVESRKIADRAFHTLTGLTAHIPPTDISEDARFVSAKYRELYALSCSLQERDRIPPPSPDASAVDEEVPGPVASISVEAEMLPPEVD